MDIKNFAQQNLDEQGESSANIVVERIVMQDLNREGQSVDNTLSLPSTSRDVGIIPETRELPKPESRPSSSSSLNREVVVVNANGEPVTSDANNMRNIGCWFYTKFILALIGLVLGLAIFFAFFFGYHNYNAALWGFASGVFSAGVVHLHILYLRGTLEEYHNRSSLTGILWFGLVGLFLSLAGLAVYLYLAISKKQEFDVKGDKYYPAATFCFLSFKWAAGLAWTARHYRRVLEHSNPALLSGVRVHPDSDTETIS